MTMGKLLQMHTTSFRFVLPAGHETSEAMIWIDNLVTIAFPPILTAFNGGRDFDSYPTMQSAWDSTQLFFFQTPNLIYVKVVVSDTPKLRPKNISLQRI